MDNSFEERILQQREAKRTEQDDIESKLQADQLEAERLSTELVDLLQRHNVPTMPIVEVTQQLVKVEKRHPGLFGKKYFENVPTDHMNEVDRGWVVTEFTYGGYDGYAPRYSHIGITTDAQVMSVKYYHDEVLGVYMICNGERPADECGSWIIQTLNGAETIDFVGRLLDE